MMAKPRGRLQAISLTVALALLLAVTPAQADPPTGDAGKSEPAAPADRPATAAPEPAPATPPPTEKKTEPAPPKLAPTDATGLLGKKVRDAAGEDMGVVVDVLVDSDGRPRAAVIDFGGFLGVGSRKIAVDWQLLQLKQGEGGMSVLLSLTRAEVQAAPEYKPSASPAQPVVVVGPPPSPTPAPTPSDAPK